MGKVYDELNPELQAWLSRQKVFFVATAPLSADGHINCTPKGGDTFRIIGPREVAYLDLTGSGIETIAHMRENGRIVIMFCAFSGPPKIVRLHGGGEVVLPDDAEYSKLTALFPANPGARAIVRVRVSGISDSCGFAVPLMKFRSDRTILDQWSEKKGPEGLAEYQRIRNRESIDGLPGMHERVAGAPAPPSPV
ncbi:MAG: pyridoxamine 5'-phosphate oxidase family protein [Opitutaceae bacterium]